MSYWALKMKKGDDECWTMCDAGTAGRARQLTEQSWGKDWSVVDVQRSKEFYVESNVGTEEEARAAAEIRRQALIKANTKPVVTPDGEFVSAKAAALHYNITQAQFSYKMRKEPHLYYRKG